MDKPTLERCPPSPLSERRIAEIRMLTIAPTAAPHEVMCRAIADLLTELRSLREAAKWRPIEERPDYDQQPGRQMIVIEGFKEHSGVTWRRVYSGDAYVHRDGPFGYRKSDIERLQLDGDMDCVERVTHWRSYGVPPLPSPPDGGR